MSNEVNANVLDGCAMHDVSFVDCRAFITINFLNFYLQENAALGGLGLTVAFIQQTMLQTRRQDLQEHRVGYV